MKKNLSPEGKYDRLVLKWIESTVGKEGWWNSLEFYKMYNPIAKFIIDIE